MHEIPLGSDFRPSYRDVGGRLSRRKFSYPVTLESSSPHGFLSAPSAASRRRFSQVSDAVQRKFSHTLGWGHRQREILAAEIVSQGRSLCSQYVRARLRRCGGTAAKKLGLQRARSTISLPLSLREVLPELVSLGRELERLHPKVYNGIVRQTCHVLSEKGVSVVLPAVSRKLMSPEINWAKVVSLYAVAGGLALDCVTQGHPEYIHVIVDSMCQALDADVAYWIADNGGWSGLLSYCKPKGTETQFRVYLGILAMILVSLSVIAIGYRWLIGVKTSPL